MKIFKKLDVWMDKLSDKLGAWAPLCMTLAGIAVCLGYWGFVSGENCMTTHGVLSTLPGMICSIVVCIFAFAVLTAVFFMIGYLITRDSAETWFRLHLTKLSERIQRRNISYIYPLVQEFLFEILCVHEDTLHLPVGQDSSCLVPRGTATAFRKNCLFFSFELILPEAPAMDTDTLRSILQQYIGAELGTHGINGLSASFGSVPTVYVDWLRYFEKTHILQFSVLYISTPDMANYAIRAEQNRKSKVTPEREVYDDEV